MKTRPCSLLLLLAASLSQGTQRCTEDAIVLRVGEARITANNGTWNFGGDFFKTMYLWPEEGFRGVGLQALTDTATGPVSLAAWFPEDIFPDVTKAAWWELEVYVIRWSDRVRFDVRLGDSWKMCFSLVTIDKLQSVAVVGYGASRWRHDTPPPGCHYQGLNPLTQLQTTTCTAPLIITLATPPTPPATPPTRPATPPTPPATPPTPPTPPATPPTPPTPPATPPTPPATPPTPPGTLPTPPAITPPPTPLPTTPQSTPEATTCPPILVEVAEMTAVLTVITGDMYHTLQRLEADQKAARGPAWPGTHHVRPHSQ
ncbi:uncharacterized protein LOC126996722 isoform X2 [Eriocheir sinensis]|uniref:uncharacterized protein LOC126996722 isoform X2 n=1 Tax=Eriocheir sinensis TaxID=95602 RepID=UPI0021C60B4F|nr:uncharacterized protein LOC126996722 isoform X2 [Eriocheir sinensis]